MVDLSLLGYSSYPSDGDLAQIPFQVPVDLRDV